MKRDAIGKTSHASTCEYRMKKWKRAWKIRLIEERNPEWADLYESLFWISKRVENV